MKRFYLPIAVLLLCLLTACGNKDAEDNTLKSYTVDADSIPAIDPLLTEETGGNLTTVITYPSEEDEKAKSEEEEEPKENVPEIEPYVAYDYQQFLMHKTGGVVKSYVSSLTTETYGFALEDEVTDKTYEAAAGSITLTRQALAQGAAPPPEDDKEEKKDKKKKKDKDDEGEDSKDAPSLSEPVPYSSLEHDPTRLFRVRVDWTPTSCLVTLDHPAGQDFAHSLLGAGTVLTFSTAKDLMLSLEPQEIGLPGKSMEDYVLIPGPGFVKVDNVACLSIDVYQKNSAGTISRMGRYFISADGAYLYRQNGNDPSEAIKIELDSGYDPSEEEAAESDEKPKDEKE